MIYPREESIPEELKAINRWLVWKMDGQGHKKPYSAKTHRICDPTSPASWTTFAEAWRAHQQSTPVDYDGVGIALNGDGLVGLDFDDCIEDGYVNNTVSELLDRIGCKYVEQSPSGKGLRAFGMSSQRLDKKMLTIGGSKVEVYSDKRYLTVTGLKLDAGSPVSNLSLDCLIAETPAANAPPQDMRPNGYPTEENRGVQKSTEENRGQQRTTEDREGGSAQTLHEIPERLIPNKAGQRHYALFELARWVKATYPTVEVTDPFMKAIVKDWHAKAVEHIDTKSFAVSWGDFAQGFDKVKFLPGDTMASILDCTDLDADLPASLVDLGCSEYDVRLINVCRALATHHHPEPFFLGARQAAGILEHADHSTAAEMLRGFVSLGILELVSKGAGKRASRYHWIWPD